MSKSSRSSRLLVIIVGLIITASLLVNAYALDLIGPDGSSQYGSGMSSSVSTAPFTIGTCDTAGPIEIESSGGTTTPTAYGTLQLAFAAIAAGTHTGAINVEVCGNTTETATASLDASGTGSYSYSSITIRPAGGARIIEGSIVGAIIKLNGADNVTIDGRQGGTGSARDLTVRNNNTSAATAAIWLASVAAGNGASNNTIRNLEIAAGTDSTSSSTNASFGIIMCGTTVSTTANGDDNDNNQFLFNRVIKARYGIVTRGTTTNLNLSPVVADNIIGPASFGTDQIGKVGIFMQADTGAIVTRNTVQNVGCLDAQACTGADRMGIAIGNESWSMAPGTITSNTYTVTRNIVHDVIEETTFSALGIDLATTGGGSNTNNLVANNFIYNIRANGTSGDQAVGLGIAGGLGDRVVFNSISMTGDVDPLASSASTNFGSGIRIGNASGATHGNLTLQNNSVYMDLSSSSTATVRFYAISGPINTFSWASGSENYNNYYINGANTQLQTGGLGTTSGNTLTTQFATLANWQTAYTTPAAQDANSIQTDPLHTSTTADLHIAVGSPNVNAGTAIAGVTRDIDNQNRVAVPDIGADEPSGITPPANDIEASSILVPANGTAFATGATTTPQARFTNVGSATVTSRQVTFSITGPGGYNYSNNQTIASIAVDEAVNVTFAAAPAFTTAGTYTMTASTAADSNTANDSVGGSFAAYAPFSGSYNVGSAETFTSLTNPGGIFAGINAAGATGNITINITSDLTSETGVVLLNEIASGFNVLIKPSGAARTISGNSGSAGLLGFNGTDGVTIDGSLSGSTDRSLTISPTQIANSGGGIYFGSGATGAQNNVVKNVNVYGNGATIGALLGIAFGSSTTFGGLGLDNDNNRVENCDIRGAFYGIASLGASAANKDTGLVITKNTFSGTGTAGIGRIGIYVIAADGAQVTANNIASVSNPGSVDTIGIAVGGQAISSAPLTSGTISNAIIARNYVGVVSNNATFSAAGIVLISDVTGTNRVQNNMVTGVIGNSNAGDIVAGIYVNGLAGSVQNVYHNSVSMTGDRGSATANMLPSYALAIATDQPTNVVNNALFNSQTRTGSTGGGGESYAIGFDGAAASANIVSNYNDLLVSGAIGVVGITGDLITAAQTTTAGTGTNQATLAAWQAATTEDANSLSVDPLFTSLTNLHIPLGSPLVNAGTDVGVTVDFDDQLRDAMRDIGADEFVVPSADLQITKTDGVTTATPGGSVTYTITAANVGPDPVTGATVADTFPGVLTGTWTCSGNTGGTCTASGSGNINDTVNLPVGGTVTYVVSAAISAGATGSLTNTATVSSSTADPIPGNNSATDTDTLVPTADLAITKTDGVTTVTAGGSTTYTITASNAGPSNAPGSTVADTFPASITAVNWTCVGAGGGTCTASGSGNINDTVNMPAGGSVTYTAVSTISGMASGTLANTATVATAGGVTDPTPGNNSATDTDTITGGGIGGTITVGSGGTYPSLTNTGGAFEAINTGPVTSNITINIISDLTGETGTVALNEIAGGFTVLIKPTGAARTISGSSTVGIVRINSADGVTIDGSLTGGTATGVGGDPTLRNLTIQNTSTTATAGGVVIVMTGTNGANNFTIKNVNVSGQDPTQTLLGIHIGGATPGASPTTAPNLNSRVENCSVQKAILGIFNNGVTATPATGTVITRNDLSATGANRLRRGGIFFFNQNGIQVTQNSIGGIDTNESADAIGIIAGNQNITTTTVATGGVSNANISGNKINGIVSVSTTGFSAAGISVGGGTLGPNVIANNMITGVTAPSTSPDLVAGIFVVGATGSSNRVLFNSIAMTGERMIVGGSATQMPSFGIAYTADVALELKDNISYTTQVSTGGGVNAKSYSIGTLATTFVNLDSNYNDFWSNGANAGGYRIGSLAAGAGTDFVTLPLWQAAVSDDANSQEVDPLYVNPLNDLHLQGTSPVLDDGTPAAGVTVDFDGQTRSVTTPDIGADEVVAVAVPGSLQFSSATYTVGEAGPTATITVTRTGGSDGVVGASYATVAGGTATGGAVCGGAVDYINTSGTVSFGNGVTTPQTFTIPICDDLSVESAETVNLSLTTPTGGATIGSPSAAVLTINDNDIPPVTYSVAVSDARMTEGNAGSANMVFNVTLTANPLSEIGGSVASVQYSTSNGTATAGSDYTTTSGTLNFNAVGTLTVSVPVAGDTNKEANEFFFVTLSSPSVNTTITDNQGAGIIVDNDRPYVADFDADLKADYSVYRPGTLLWYALQSGSGTPKISGAGPTGGVAVTGDYDGDGKADFATFQASSGVWSILRSSTNALQLSFWGGAGDKPVQGDYDGDGKTDLAIYRPSAGQWWINRSSDNSSYVVTFGISTDRLVQGDYDGDAKTDQAVYRDGSWFVLRSSNGTVQFQNWGNAADKPVSGDFDGDGRNDFAIYRAGTWWVINSLSGASSVIPFGLATDVPAPADFDGDGSTDLTVFRPSTGDWFVLRSSNLTLTGVNWGINGDVPAPSSYIPQ